MKKTKDEEFETGIFKELKEKAIKEILVNSKWISAVSEVLNQELERVIITLSKRLSELSARYLIPLPEIQKDREDLSKKVHEHLVKMGVRWE